MRRWLAMWLCPQTPVMWYENNNFDEKMLPHITNINTAAPDISWGKGR